MAPGGVSRNRTGSSSPDDADTWRSSLPCRTSYSSSCSTEASTSSRGLRRSGARYSGSSSSTAWSSWYSSPCTNAYAAAASYDNPPLHGRIRDPYVRCERHPRRGRYRGLRPVSRLRGARTRRTRRPATHARDTLHARRGRMDGGSMGRARRPREPQPRRQHDGGHPHTVSGGLRGRGRLDEVHAVGHRAETRGRPLARRIRISALYAPAPGGGSGDISARDRLQRPAVVGREAIARHGGI